MTGLLVDFAAIKAGHPFRGAVKDNAAGNARVVQIKNVTEEGELQWGELIQADVSGHRSPVWLQQGDVLLAARGARNTAAYINELSAPTVCVPHFYIIQVIDASAILPEFLAWQLNQQHCQRYFEKSVEGAQAKNIRRKVLENTPITVPSLKQQQLIIELANTLKRERAVALQLIEKGDAVMRSIANNLKNKEL